MIVAHVAGIPLEETLVQLAPAGAATVAALAIAGRTTLGRLQRRFRREAAEPAALTAARSASNSPSVPSERTTPGTAAS
jgi:hypothetical protein